MKEQGRDRVVESHDGKIENTQMNTAGDDRIDRVVESHDGKIENTEMKTDGDERIGKRQTGRIS